MSVERVKRKSGTVYRVRWRDASGERSRVIGRKRDAEAFEAKLILARRTGDLAGIDAGKQTVAEVAEAWFTSHVIANLATTTQDLYARLWDKHVHPRIGHLAVRDVTHPVVTGLAADLKASGVGPQAMRRALSLGQQVFGYALSSGYVNANPFVGVRKPSAKRARAVVPMTPSQVEAIRTWFLERGRERDAVLVSLMAYAGLRPAEAYGVTWDKVHERTLLIDCSAQNGVMKGTKTGSFRAVAMLAPLAIDLAEWRMRCGRPEAGIVIPGHDGEIMRRTESQNWAKRAFRNAASAAGFPKARPYDLRHSFCSLLIHEGRLSIAQIAVQMGHNMNQTLLVYGHVFAEADGGAGILAEEAIRLARTGHVSVLCPPEPGRPLADEG